MVEDSHGVRAILVGDWGEEGSTFYIPVAALEGGYTGDHLKHTFNGAGPKRSKTVAKEFK